MEKILIVGGVAGGASVAARLRRHSEDYKLIIFEKGKNVSFSNCSLPYHLSGVVPTTEKLVLMSPEKFLSHYNIEARVNSEVIEIDRVNKKVKVLDHLNNKEYYENYDKLVLSPGAKPIVPPIPGLEKANYFTIRNVEDIDRLNKFIKINNHRDVVIVGGGFIGIETAENLRKAGYNVTIVEATNQILKIFDYSMVQILHKELYDNGVNLILEEKVVELDENEVILNSGKKVKTDVVVLAIGVTPDIELAKKAGLELGETKALKVDQNFVTSDKDIYAVGDAIEVYNSLTKEYTRLSLAGPALKQARNAADHISGMRVQNRGYIGSSTLKVFDYNAAVTGLTESLIKEKKLSINYGVVEHIHSDRVSLMPEARPVHIKLLYEIPTGKILGAQGIGKGDAVKRIDVVATVIKFGGTIDDLRDLELCYAPPYGTGKDVVNYSGYIATNLLNGDYKQISYSEVRRLVEEKACIIDVREINEFEGGSIKGAINIPLSQLRERVNEFPKDRPVYIHCRSGQRSYNACRVLENLGYDNVYNVTGGFLGLSFFEYFNDIFYKREPIVTKYNFS